MKLPTATSVMLILCRAVPVHAAFEASLSVATWGQLLLTLLAYQPRPASGQGAITDQQNVDCEHCSHCYQRFSIPSARGAIFFKTLDVSFHNTTFGSPANEILDYSTPFTLQGDQQCESCLDNQHRTIMFNLRNPDRNVDEVTPSELWISNPGGIVEGVAWDYRYVPPPTVAMNSTDTNYVHPCYAQPSSNMCESTKGPNAHGDPIYISGFKKDGPENIPSGQIFSFFLSGCDYWPEKREVSDSHVLMHYPADPQPWIEFQIGEGAQDDCAYSHVSPDCVPPAPEVEPADQTVAEQFVRICLNAIRLSVPNPPLHARNLYHLSAAMWDAFVAYDDAHENTGVLFQGARLASTAGEREEAIAFAAYGLLRQRYTSTEAVGLDDTGKDLVRSELDQLLLNLGYNPQSVNTLSGSESSAVGNRIAQAIIDHFLNDGSGEPTYSDVTNYMSLNDPLFLGTSGTNMTNPDHFQPLEFDNFITQNEIEIGAFREPLLNSV